MPHASRRARTNLTKTQIMQRQHGVLLNPSRSIPQELVDGIIDCLHDDHASLRVCSLVAPSWTRCAQSNLFRTVLLTCSEDLERFQERFHRKRHLAFHVRTLRIKVAHEQYEWIRAVPPCLLIRLPLLRALHFERVKWTTKANNTVDTSFLASLAVCKALRELSFDKCEFATFEDFEKMVCACGDGRLGKLSLDIVSWEDKRSTKVLEKEKRTDRWNRERLSSLTHVSIGRYCSMSLMCNWLRQTPACSTLRSVEFINITQVDELQAVSDVIRTVGHSLEHLKLSCQTTLAETASKFIWSIQKHLNLSPLTGLRTLHVALHDLSDEILYWVPIVLDGMRAPLLERVKFDVWVQRVERREGKAWQALVKWITGLRSVSEIRFVQRGQATAEEARYWFEGAGLGGLGRLLCVEERREDWETKPCNPPYNPDPWAGQEIRYQYLYPQWAGNVCGGITVHQQY
ncbi:hypothetical protein BC835DRAFT_1304847 [Cytidiella melzeri]|nr:hypothetical protein BC835DRAFT_1304847 [Cytidiella melzeri]